MKAQIISISIIFITAVILAILGISIHKKENKVKAYFKWPKFKK